MSFCAAAGGRRERSLAITPSSFALCASTKLLQEKKRSRAKVMPGTGPSRIGPDTMQQQQCTPAPTALPMHALGAVPRFRQC